MSLFLRSKDSFFLRNSRGVFKMDSRGVRGVDVTTFAEVRGRVSGATIYIITPERSLGTPDSGRALKPYATCLMLHVV